MHVQGRNNLTIDLIRQQRFDVAYERLADVDCHRQAQHLHQPCDRVSHAVDRVQLSPEALSYERYRSQTPRDAEVPHVVPAAADASSHVIDTPGADPQPITPVVGSPALAGLGVALVVPGTLLDVFA